MAACNDPACTDTATITEVDGSGSNGLHTSITIGVDGNPIISYYRQTGRDLYVAACNDPACTGTATITEVDGTGRTGLFTSITIGVDGNPIISYYNTSNGDLMVAACSTTDCTATATATATAITSSGTISGLYSSIAIGANGNPIISYYNQTSGDLYVAACNDPVCDTAATITELDASGNIGQHTSITIGVDGNPIISYHNQTSGDLYVAACSTTDCTAATIAALDTSGITGQYTSITIGINGNPIIAYHNQTSGELRAYACGNMLCNPHINGSP